MRLLTLYALFLIGIADISHAESTTGLRPGLTFSEVVQLRGPPLSKDVHEVKRTVLWRYADGTLRFVEGRLVLPKSAIAPHSQASKKTRKTAPASDSAPSPRSDATFSQRTVDEIIAAIPNDKADTSSAMPPNQGLGQTAEP